MERIGVDPAGIRLMTPKQFHCNLKLEGLSPAQANVIKQDMLSIGGEAAIAKGAVSCEVKTTGCILSGTVKQFLRLVEKLKLQPYGLSGLSVSINEAVENLYSGRLIFKGRTKKWDTRVRTVVMGILNVTPDSFFDGGRFFTKERAVERALEMMDEGADIIDIGGESTRPGSAAVEKEEELRRVLPVVEELAKRGIPASIDTTKSGVAEEALKRGAEAVNDVSAMTKDEKMAEVVSRYSSGLILMHSRGTPAAMQKYSHYDDLMAEIFGYLSERMDYAHSFGIEAEKIVVDPGIGFAKSAADNLEIIRRMAEFKTLGRPILIGTSRKSFIEKVLNLPVDERLSATLATVAFAVQNGAGIVRVHDVKEARQAVDIIDAIVKKETPLSEAKG